MEEATTHHGAPMRPTGVASWLLVSFLIVVLAIVACFLATTDFVRKETVEGMVTPDAGAIRLVAPKAGIVTAVNVREGDALNGGEALLTISGDNTVLGGRTLSDLEGQADTAQSSAIDAELDARFALSARQRDDIGARRVGQTAQIRSLDASIALQGKRASLAQQSVTAARSLHDQGLMPDVQYEARQDAALSAQQALSDLERQQAQLEQSLAQLDIEQRKLGAQSAEDEAQAAASRAELLTRRADSSSQKGLVLTSQRAGRVAALTIKPGAAVAAGQTLAVILPSGARLQAQLWAPSRAVAFVRPGDRVALMYDAFPYERFGLGRGRVVGVSAAPVSPEELPFPPTSNDKQGLYVIDVALDQQAMRAYGRAWPLVPGMRLAADIVLEKRSLLDWLLDPVLAARQRQAAER